MIFRTISYTILLYICLLSHTHGIGQNRIKAKNLSFFNCINTKSLSNPELYLAKRLFKTKFAVALALIAEPIPVVAGVNTLPREIFLPAVDLNTFGIQVSQTQDVILTNPTFPGVEVKIFAGSVKNPDGTTYTGKLMVLQVPREKTPLALPKGIQPDIVAAVQPGGLILNPPAQLTMPNTDQYPQGSVLDMHSLNPNTGVFEKVGKMQAQGNQIITTQGGMNFSAWHFPGAPPCDITNQSNPVAVYIYKGYTHCCASVANSTTGDLEEDYVLPSVRFLGQDFAPRLVYHSSNAFPRVNVQNNADFTNSIKPRKTTDLIRLAGINVAGATRDTQSATGDVFRVGHQIDVSDISSGILPVDYDINAEYLGSSVTTPSESKVIINNQSKSPFGAGWTLDLPVSGSFSRIHLQTLGDVLLLEGDGSSKRFVPEPGAPGLICIGNQLWEVSFNKQLKVYNATTLELLHESLLTPNINLVAIGFTHDPEAKKVYVLLTTNVSQIIEVDMETFAKRESAFFSFRVDLPSNTRDLLILSKDKELIYPVSNFGLVRINAATLELAGTEVIPGFSKVRYLKVSQDGTKAWLLGAFVSTMGLREFDLENNFDILRSLDFGAFTQEHDFTSNEVRDELYVTIHEINQLSLYIVDLNLNAAQPETFAVKRQINFAANFSTFVPPSFSGGPVVSPGIGSHIYVNLRDKNTLNALGSVLKLVDTADGSILNSNLATDVRFIDSVAGDPRLFVLKFFVTATKIQILDGETGLLLEETDLRIAAGGLLTPQGPNNSVVFTSPPQDFSVLTYNNNNTESDLTDDFFIRRMKDGTEHKYNNIGLLQQIKDRNDNTFTFSYIDADNDGKAEELSSFTTPVNTQYTFAYANGKLTSITDPAGRMNSFNIDADGNLIRIDKPDNTQRQFAYTDKHLLTSQTNERNFTTRYEYDQFGHIKKSILPDDCTFLYKPEHGAALVDPSATTPPTAIIPGEVASNFTDARGNPSSAKTDDLHEITEWTDQNGKTQSTQRDANSLPTNINDRRGVDFVQTWDEKGNLLSGSQNDLGITSSCEYEPTFNLPIKCTNPRGAVTVFERDEKGNLTKITDHLGNETSFMYNSQGLITSVTDELGRVTTYTRDSNGNIATITDANNNPTTLTRDAAGNVLTLTDELLRVTTFTYDPLNRLLTRKNALGDVATWVYDNYGNITSFSDENNHSTTMVYDERNRLTSRTNPIGDTETITLDENSNVTKMVDFKGKITLYQYDKLNRLVKQIRKIGDTADIEDADDIVSTVAYDPEANILAITDAEGRKTYMKYDQLHRVTQVNRKVGDTLDEINANDSVTKFTYDLASNIVLAVDPSNEFVYRDFDLLDRLTKVIQKIGDTANTEDVDDIVTTFEYDGVHNNTKITDGNGKVIYRKFDNLDRLTKVIRKVTDTADVIDANDAVTSMVYDDVDNLLSVTRPNNIVVSQTFDKLDRVETLTNGAGETDSIEYDPVGNVLKVTRANGNIINMAYDVLDRMTSATDAHGGIISRTYDPVNNVLSQTDGNNNTISYKYDDIHRVFEITDALGKSSFVSYDKVDNITQTKDRNENITTRTFDDLDRLITHKDALNFTTTYTYNESSDLTSITDTLSRTTTYTYDDIHRLSKTTYADSAEVSLGYDKVHNITSRIDQNGATTNYTYNDLYFLTQRSYPVDASEVFAHDKDGRILTASKADWTCTYQYDGADRITQEISNGKTLAKTYDIPARTYTCTYPNGRTLTKIRDKRDRLIEIKDSDNSTIAQYSYDPGNRITSCTTENGITRTNGYNANNWLTSIDHRKTSTNTQIAGFNYSHDNEGNILSIEDQLFANFSQKLELDAIYRIINFKQGQLNAGDIAAPNREISYNLDGVGNWLSKTTDGVLESRQHNEVHEISSVDGIVFTHDNNGNLKDDGNQLYNYDTENRLVEVTRKSDGVVLAQFQYDAMSRRVRKKSFDPNTGILSKQTEFYCDGPSVIEEYEKDADAGSNLGAERLARQFIDGDRIDTHILQDIYDAAGNIAQSLYYCINHRDDSSVITDENGNVQLRLFFDTYGKAFKLNAQNQLEEFNDFDLVIFTLQGRRNDSETELMYFRARYYSTSLGRFFQRDPIEYKGSMGLYEAFYSNAHIYNDFDGLKPKPRRKKPSGAARRKAAKLAKKKIAKLAAKRARKKLALNILKNITNVAKQHPKVKVAGVILFLASMALGNKCKEEEDDDDKKKATITVLLKKTNVHSIVRIQNPTSKSKYLRDVVAHLWPMDDDSGRVIIEPYPADFEKDIQNIEEGEREGAVYKAKLEPERARRAIQRIMRAFSEPPILYTFPANRGIMRGEGAANCAQFVRVVLKIAEFQEGNVELIEEPGTPELYRRLLDASGEIDSVWSLYAEYGTRDWW